MVGFIEKLRQERHKSKQNLMRTLTHIITEVFQQTDRADQDKDRLWEKDLDSYGKEVYHTWQIKGGDKPRDENTMRIFTAGKYRGD